MIEQYILTNVAVKTDYYDKHPAMLVYAGINSKLVKDLNLFHIKNTIKFLKDKENDVQRSVSDLIDRSMSTYYFEQIGNAILEIRKMIRQSPRHKELIACRSKLVDLINAYNLYSDRKVTLDEVLPNELMPFVAKKIKQDKID